MQESYEEELAIRFGPDPYAGGGDALGVASVMGTGRPAIELRHHPFRVPTLLCQGEGNRQGRVIGERSATRRSPRTCACLETPNARTGRSHRFPVANDHDEVCHGNGQSTSQAVLLT